MYLGARLLLMSITFIFIPRCVKSQLVNVSSIQSTKLVLSIFPDEVVFAAIGSLQINVKDTSQVLIGLRRAFSLSKAACIAVIPVDNLTDPDVNTTITSNMILYGNISAAMPTSIDFTWDGTRFDASFHSPEHIYNTEDYIYFLDARSCARKITRATKVVRTVLGECAADALNITGTDGTTRVLGMVVFEEEGLWIFSVENFGIYIWSEGMAEPRQLLTTADLQNNVHDSTAELERGVNADGTLIVWGKVTAGVNMYNFTGINGTHGELVFDTNFFRYFGTIQISTVIMDPTLFAGKSSPSIGRNNADMATSPDGTILVKADTDTDKLIFLTLLREMDPSASGDVEIQFLCDKSDEMEDNVDNCTFNELGAVMWLDEHTIVVNDYIKQTLRIVNLERPVTTTTTTTAIPTTSEWTTSEWTTSEKTTSELTSTTYNFTRNTDTSQLTSTTTSTSTVLAVNGTNTTYSLAAEVTASSTSSPTASSTSSPTTSSTSSLMSSATSTGMNTTASIYCPNACDDGSRSDKNGVVTCECIPTGNTPDPPTTPCPLSCKYGFEKGDNGEYLCRCAKGGGLLGAVIALAIICGIAVAVGVIIGVLIWLKKLSVTFNFHKKPYCEDGAIPLHPHHPHHLHDNKVEPSEGSESKQKEANDQTDEGTPKKKKSKGGKMKKNKSNSQLNQLDTRRLPDSSQQV